MASLRTLVANDRHSNISVHRLHRYNNNFQSSTNSSEQVLTAYKKDLLAIQSSWKWLETRISEKKDLELAKAYSESICDAAPLMNILNHGSLPLGRINSGLQIAQTYGFKLLEMRHLSNLGDLHLNIGKYKDAVRDYEQALTMQDSIDFYDIKGRLCSRIAQAYNYLGDTAKARYYYEKAMPLLVDAGDKKEESRCYGGLGWLAGDIGDIQAALNNYKKALNLAREAKDDVQEAVHLGAIGTHTLQSGYAEEAIGYMREAVKLSGALGDTRREGTRSYNLGAAYRHLGNYELAFDFLKRARDIAIRNEDTRIQGLVHGIVGECLSDLGDFKNAMLEQKIGLELLKAAGFRKYIVFAEVGLGETLLLMGSYDQALEQLFKSKELASSANMPAPHLTSALAIARVYLHSMNKLDEAIKCVEEVEALDIPLYDYNVPLIGGVVYFRMGRIDHAYSSFLLAKDKIESAISKSPKLLRPMYAKGLCLAGLSVTNTRAEARNLITESRNSFSSAIETSDCPGIKHDALVLINELAVPETKKIILPVIELFQPM